MFDFPPISYDEPVYRPPSEAGSLLIPVTRGCSYNGCAFCAMYRRKQYAIRSLENICSDLRRTAVWAAERGAAPRKVFLCDGDALSAPAELLLAVLTEIKALFPSVSRAGIYASARNVLDKSTGELSSLASKMLRIAYVGVESGSDAVLKMVKKGSSAEEAQEACLRLSHCGWKVSQIFMLGLGGRELSGEHCRRSAELVSAVAPNFLSFLTTVPVPGTPYARAIKRGEIEPLSARELLTEMRDIVAAVRPDSGKIIFRANHVSNQFPLEGILPRDTEKLKEQIGRWIRECPEGVYPEVNPAYL